MAGMGLETESLTPAHWLAIALAAATGIVHLALGLGNVPDPLALSFVAAGIGFFVGIYLVLIDYRRTLVILLGIPFVIAQIVLYYVFNQPTLSTISPIALVDKVVQIALVVLLVYLYRRRRTPTPGL